MVFGICTIVELTSTTVIAELFIGSAGKGGIAFETKTFHNLLQLWDDDLNIRVRLEIRKFKRK